MPLPPRGDDELSPSVPEERIPPRRLMAFVIMVFGMFMSILDIRIVSASLAEIQAACRRVIEKISWVQTAYLIAEVIAIPLSGFLSRAFGTRMLSRSPLRASPLRASCVARPTIEQMIVWRAIQGFIGAGMIPTVFASA